MAVYRHLPRSPRLKDPLPPVYEGTVYHYTSLAGVHGLIGSKVAWASSVQDLNDPSERLYGWDVIRGRFASHRPPGSSHAIGELKTILEQADEPGDWYPQAFVLSASMVADSLTQYRLYGQCQVAFAGGTWDASPPNGHRQLRDLMAVWRPVLYGPAAAMDYVDRMLAAAASIMDSVAPEDYTDETLVAMFALEVLALHIKNPAYEDEREVRLVFSTDDNLKVRVGDNRLITYLEARPVHDDGLNHHAEPELVEAVRLGPLAGGKRSAAAIRIHHQNSTGDPRRFFGSDERKLEVALSETPYRG